MIGKLSHINKRFSALGQNLNKYEADMVQRMIAELLNDSVLCNERVIEGVLVIRVSSRSRKDS